MSNKYVTDYVPKDPFPYRVRPNLYESEFSPSGLVPYPCTHGLAALPLGHPQVAHEPRRNPAGEELPAFAGSSWGRSKYLRIAAYGGRTEHLPGGQEVYAAMAVIRCPVCAGEPRPADMTEPAG